LLRLVSSWASSARSLRLWRGWGDSNAHRDRPSAAPVGPGIWGVEGAEDGGSREDSGDSSAITAHWRSKSRFLPICDFSFSRIETLLRLPLVRDEKGQCSSIDPVLRCRTLHTSDVRASRIKSPDACKDILAPNGGLSVKRPVIRDSDDSISAFPGENTMK
jgi:hypothetical protein